MIVTIGTLGLNFEILMAVRPVLEITIIHAADRFFEASATDYKMEVKKKLKEIGSHQLLM